MDSDLEIFSYYLVNNSIIGNIITSIGGRISIIGTKSNSIIINNLALDIRVIKVEKVL